MEDNEIRLKPNLETVFGKEIRMRQHFWSCMECMECLEESDPELAEKIRDEMTS